MARSSARGTAAAKHDGDTTVAAKAGGAYHSDSLGYTRAVAITREQVRHIARLANLEFSDAEQERFTRQLSAILDHVETLNRLDTSAVEPTAHAGGDAVLLRDDALRPTLDRDAALAVAPDADRGLVKVPRVLG